MAQQGTGTPQDPIKTKLYFQKKGLVYEVGGGGGGSGGPTQYIKTPVILSPVNEATGVSVLATIRVSEYENLFESDEWANRHVQIATVGEFTAESIVYDHMEKATEFQVTDPPLPANTTLYIRAKDYSEDGLESEWSNIVMFTTGDAITVNKPELQLFGWHESTSDFVQTIKATGSEFSVTQGQIDNHIKTDWWIEQASTRSNVHIWESMSDTTNLTSITTPEIEVLQPSTKYVFCCVYHGEKYGASPVSMKEFTTSSDFGKVNTPTLSVEGGPSDVYETPRLTATAFSNTRDPDTHVSTNWKIVLASDADGTPVWESTTDMVNKTEITVPKGRLQPGTSYIAMVQYNGQVYGLSEWAQYQFSTVAAFSSINTPTLTVDGAPSSVLETPTLTLSAFGGDNATHKNTHFKVLKNDANALVWETSVAAPAVSVKVPLKTLQPNTTYKFQGWYEAVEGVTSAVAEVVATTKDVFIPINDIGKPDKPTFGVGIPSDEVAESFIPGIQKHPDFYDETKPGYGTWVVPETLIKNTTKWDGAFKFIPKFYWMPLFNGIGGEDNVKTNEELQAILPYVDVSLEQMNEIKYKYPTTGFVIAKTGVFKNEAEANAHGFILPAAFLDGGKEKDGFFIAVTETSVSIEEEGGNNVVKFHHGRLFGESLEDEYLFAPSSDFTKINALEKNETLQDLPFTYFGYAIYQVAEGCSSRLQVESCFALAAIRLLTLYLAQFGSATSCKWFDPNGLTSYPKGLNNESSDIDDASVSFPSLGPDRRLPLFPTTQDGFSKTTHNGAVTGITHLNGWDEKITTGIFPRGERAGYKTVLDPARFSIYDMKLSVFLDTIQTQMGHVIPSLRLYYHKWYDSPQTPFFTDLTSKERLLNCVIPRRPSSNPPDYVSVPRFGDDSTGITSSPNYSYYFQYGGGYSDKKGAGIFHRFEPDIKTGSNDGGRLFGYPELNSDGTRGSRGVLILPQGGDYTPPTAVSFFVPEQSHPYILQEGEGTYKFSIDELIIGFASTGQQTDLTFSVGVVDENEIESPSDLLAPSFTVGTKEDTDSFIKTYKNITGEIEAQSSVNYHGKGGLWVKVTSASNKKSKLVQVLSEADFHL